MNDRSQWAVPLDKWCQPCDPAAFSFQTTADTPLEAGILGQQRARDALDFGLRIGRRGFHVLVVGERTSGRHALIAAMTADLARSRPAPSDWCFVHNFEQPDEPLALELPAGEGRPFQRDLTALVESVKQALEQAFDSDTYREQIAANNNQLNEERNEELDALTKLATENGYALRPTPVGMASIAVVDGKPLSREEFDRLPPERREAIEEAGRRVQTAIDETFNRLHRAEHRVRETVGELNRELARYHAVRQIQPLRERYAKYSTIVAHLERLAEQIVEDADFFRGAVQPPPGLPAELLPSPFTRYQANVLVANDPQAGAPVVTENNPTFYNLLGGIDYRSQLGVMTTDFTMVKAGALQRANGGFLILDALELLQSPFVWPALKRALRDGVSRIENAGEQLRLAPMPTLRPAPIPLDLKVVLVCEPRTYYLLHALDPETRDLFKVKAEFEPELDRAEPDLKVYAAFCRQRCEEEGLLPLDVCAVARLVDHGSRLRGDRRKVTTRFGLLADVIREADYRARQQSAAAIGVEHIRLAIEARQARAGLPREMMLERIRDGLLMIATDGAVVGQVNGLSVLSLGDIAIGRPSRITARVAFGGKGIVDIERETEMSGPIHSKGVFILGGYLAGQFGQQTPLALSATLTFEQAYEGVEGDSASSAELYALLSSLAEAPIDQSVAVTGSVNQRGEIQPVGGVTEKVEGFFQACQARGLTGRQGVMLPRSNIRHLVLDDETTAAIRDGRFHLWAVESIAEGIELLTGIAAGAPDAQGKYPPETLFGRVQDRLSQFAEQLRRFGRGDQETHS